MVEELDRTVASFEELKARNEELQESEDSLKELCKEFEEENITLQDELDDSSYKYVIITGGRCTKDSAVHLKIVVLSSAVGEVIYTYICNFDVELRGDLLVILCSTIVLQKLKGLLKFFVEKRS